MMTTTYRLKVDVEAVAVWIRGQTFNILEQFWVSVKEMRPGNGHGCAKLAGTNVKEPLRAARIAHRTRRAKTSVVWIRCRCVERVDRRAETIALGRK